MSVTAIGTGAVNPLVKLAYGEYTAASVAANPRDAMKLALLKLPNGNYCTPPLPPSVGEKSSSGVLSSLTAMTLGGA